MTSPLDHRSLERRVAALEARLAGFTAVELRLQRWRYVATIVEIASALTGVSAADIIGPLRSARIVHVRFAVCWAARQLTPYSLPRIGQALGGRDHTSIMNAIARAGELRRCCPDFRAMSDALLAAARAELEAPRQ